MIQILKKYFEKLIIAILSTDIEYKMNTEPIKFQEGLDKSSDKFMYIMNHAIEAYQWYDRENYSMMHCEQINAFVPIWGNILYKEYHLYLVKDSFDKNILNKDYWAGNFNQDDIILIK